MTIFIITGNAPLPPATSFSASSSSSNPSDTLSGKRDFSVVSDMANLLYPLLRVAIAFRTSSPRRHRFPRAELTMCDGSGSRHYRETRTNDAHTEQMQENGFSRSENEKGNRPLFSISNAFAPIALHSRAPHAFRAVKLLRSGCRMAKTPRTREKCDHAARFARTVVTVFERRGRRPYNRLERRSNFVSAFHDPTNRH